jgi:hypothetical protein
VLRTEEVSQMASVVEKLLSGLFFGILGPTPMLAVLTLEGTPIRTAVHWEVVRPFWEGTERWV